MLTSPLDPNAPEFEFGTQSVSSIPNIIWTFWHDEKNIPELVQTCIRSWGVQQES